MTTKEFFDKFYILGLGIPFINPGDVPILLSNSKAYIPDPSGNCKEYSTEQDAERAYPGARTYITVKTK